MASKPTVPAAANVNLTEAVHKPPEVVLFVDPTRRKKSELHSTTSQLTKKPEAGEIAPTKRGRARYRNQKKKVKTQLDQFRLDVRKFGTSGFQEKMKDKINEKIAIKLGAKPPKNKYTNYKDVMHKVKIDRVKEKTEREINRKLGLQVKKPPKPGKDDKKSKKSSFSCQVGYYKDGFQHVPKKLIHSINKKS